MNKITRLLPILLVLAVLLTVCAFAEEKTVYIGGENPDAVDTFAEALDALDGEGGTVVLGKNVTLGKTAIPEQSGDLRIIADAGNSLIITGEITLGKNTNDNTFIFDCPIIGENGTVYGGFNSVTFTENCEMQGVLNFYGGVVSPEGGDETDFRSGKLNQLTVTDLPYTVTVANGNFGNFECGNVRPTYETIIGSIGAPLTVNISGGTFGNPVSFAADDPLKLDRAFSLSGMSILASDATLNISGGTFNLPVYAQGYIFNTCTAASKNSQIVKASHDLYAADGDITFNITGGRFNGCEISAEQTGPTYNLMLRGDFEMNISEDAVLAAGTVLDATQVKAYEGSDNKATLTVPAAADVVIKRFDTVNGEAQTYTEPLRIACVGDSITQGTGTSDFQHNSYPSQLLQKIAAEGKDVIVSNFGCGATKVMNYSDLWYNDTLAYTISMEECDADYIVIGLGTNDAATSRYCIGQVDHFERMYTDFITGYAELPNTQMVYGTSALYRVGTALAATANIRGTQAKVLNKLHADGVKATYVDLYALLLDDCLAGKVLGSDNLHPNTNGYTLYKDVVYNAIFNGVTEVENFAMDDIWVSASGKLTGKGTQDDPISDIAMALSKAADGATIHIVGTVIYDQLGDYSAFTTPTNLTSLHFVGEGSGATLSVNTKLFYIYSDMTFDNMKLRYSGSETSALYICCNYHNVEFTETFSTTGTKGAIMILGCLTFNEDDTASYYNAPAAVSSDKDITATINGGSYYYIIGGNRHWSSESNAGDAAFGTYSGDMTINIGKNVVLNSSASYLQYNAAVGQNYLAGTVTVNLNKPLEKFYAYAPAGNYDSTRAKHDETKNTGSITLHCGEDVTATMPVIGDFTGNGKAELDDALQMIRYMLNGFDPAKSENFYFKTEISLLNVIHALKKLSLPSGWTDDNAGTWVK